MRSSRTRADTRNTQRAATTTATTTRDPPSTNMTGASVAHAHIQRICLILGMAPFIRYSIIPALAEPHETFAHHQVVCVTGASGEESPRAAVRNAWAMLFCAHACAIHHFRVLVHFEDRRGVTCRVHRCANSRFTHKPRF